VDEDDAGGKKALGTLAAAEHDILAPVRSLE
jgi:hypothetical protein